MFVDIIDKTSKLSKIVDISPRPPTELILRVVIWEAENVPSEDFEDVTDMYVKVGLTSFGLEGRTDTHYRAAEHYGSFNWRINFNIKVKGEFQRQDFRLDFFIYDKDFLSGDDYVAQKTYDISNLV